MLTRDNEIEETMFLGLRMMEGVNVRRFKETFGTDLEVIYRPQIERMEKLGLLAIRGGNLCLTERGIDVSNQVLACGIPAGLGKISFTAKSCISR